MPSYTSVTIIYNPRSTGPGETMAMKLARSLRAKLSDTPVMVTPTNHAGHAEVLTYELATSERQPLIISASGDGGYNEVVNGAMRAAMEDHQPMVGLLPAGNANDHYHSLHDGDLVTAIVAGTPRAIDVLRLQAKYSGQRTVRYAHSYIGFGLSPHVGQRLTRAKLNKFNEAWLTLDTLLRVPHTELELAGVTRQYDNFVLSNIPRMAKVMTFSARSRIDDGRFEITQHEYEGRLKMFAHLFRASSVGLTDPEVRSQITLRTCRATSLQCDGEVVALPEPAAITVTSLHQALRCFV